MDIEVTVRDQVIRLMDQEVNLFDLVVAIYLQSPHNIRTFVKRVQEKRSRISQSPRLHEEPLAIKVTLDRYSAHKTVHPALFSHS